METTSNGNPGRGPILRYRLDPRAGGVRPETDPLGRGHSGRRLVILLVLGVLVVWGTVYLAFSRWRAAYRERAAFGASQVAPAVDPLAKLVPPGVSPATWDDTVAQTHALIEHLTGSGALTLDQMKALRADLSARVERVQDRPDSAELELVRLWSDLRARAGPILASVPTPGLLALASVLDPIASRPPEGVTSGAWNQAIDDTRQMLVDITTSGALTPERHQALVRDLAGHIRGATPRTLTTALTRIWDDAEKAAPAVVAKRPRPALLRPAGQ